MERFSTVKPQFVWHNLLEFFKYVFSPNTSTVKQNTTAFQWELWQLDILLSPSQQWAVTFNTCGSNTLGELARGPLTAILFQYLIRGKLFSKAEKTIVWFHLISLGKLCRWYGHLQIHIPKLFMMNITDASSLLGITYMHVVHFICIYICPQKSLLFQNKILKYFVR